MIDTCFVVSSDKEECKTFKNDIKNILHIDNIANVNIKESDLTIGTLLSLKLIDEKNNNISNNDLNKLITSKAENRFLSVSEIKEYIEHVNFWRIILKDNIEKALVIDNRVKLKNKLETFQKLKKGIEHLPDFYGVLGICEKESPFYEFKCNDYINYSNINHKLGYGYIITKSFAQELLKIAFPLRSTIHRLLVEISLLNKKGYQMKYPILELNKKKDNGNMLLSLPVNNFNLLDPTVYIFDEGDESYILNNINMKKEWKNVEDVDSEYMGLTKIVNTKQPGLVINSKNDISKKILDNIGDIFPVNMHFLGWTEKQLKEPFVFSNILEYVHPKMPRFECYYVTPDGAKLLLNIFNTGKENYINTILSRERVGFAHVVDKL